MLRKPVVQELFLNRTGFYNAVYFGSAAFAVYRYAQYWAVYRWLQPIAWVLAIHSQFRLSNWIYYRYLRPVYDAMFKFEVKILTKGGKT